jgi:hypothetical protein
MVHGQARTIGQPIASRDRNNRRASERGEEKDMAARIWLFLRIVYRTDWTGGRLSPSDAWEISAIVHGVRP